MKKNFYGLFLIFSVSSCGIISKSTNSEFKDGFYSQNIDNKKQLVYVNAKDEAINVHPAKCQKNKRIIDTSDVARVYKKELVDDFKQISFNKNSFDIDFLTIPLKYRPAQSGVPPQLNTNLNGAIYFGLRNDRYNVNYIPNPLGKSERVINHFGFSLGLYTGMGNTFMSPTNTNGSISIEYDGLVWSKGIAGIVGINDVTIGFSAGYDNLLDKNKKLWVYENKPWFGLVFGLNLN